MRLRHYIALGCLGLAILVLPPCSFSQEANVGEVPSEDIESVEEIDESLGEVIVDVQGSLGDRDTRLGLSFDGDLRAGYLFAGDGLGSIHARNID